ncbi:UNVERIFIED_CONTAM: hypothetical protein NCL1_53153 [Trichonephila clavipes]
MASQFGEISLRNSCLAFIQLNFNFPQRVPSLIEMEIALHCLSPFLQLYKNKRFQEYDEEDVETRMACDEEDWKFQMLIDEEIVTSVQEESYPVDDETDEDEDHNKESNKGASNADAFSALEIAMGWYEQQSEYCPTQLLLLKRVRDLAAKKRRCTMRSNDITYQQLQQSMKYNLAWHLQAGSATFEVLSDKESFYLHKSSDALWRLQREFVREFLTTHNTLPIAHNV